MSALLRFTQFVQKTFALWVIIFAALALWQPEFFVWLKAYIPWILGIIMLGMGMTMTVDDFKGVLQSPKAVLIGVVAQFVVMPGLAFILCKLSLYTTNFTEPLSYQGSAFLKLPKFP
ncbi:hypothetical protein ACFH1V_15855, partial [Acinetobacter baumannii]